MSSTRCLYLFALVALFAVVVQLPTRLLELAAAAGDVLFFLSLGLMMCMMSIPIWSRPPQMLLTVAGYSVFWTVSGLIAVTNSRFRNVGYVASLVDDLHRDEGRRSRLQRQYIKLRNEYKKQQSVLASLNHDIARVCKEHNNHCREFPIVFPRILRHDVSAAPFQDTEWTEPYTLIKMCKSCLFLPILRHSMNHPLRLLVCRIRRQQIHLSLSHSISPLPFTVRLVFFLATPSPLMLTRSLAIDHATDLKVVFLSGKVEQLRAAVLANDDRIRQQSAALEEVQQAALDIVKRINEHRVKLYHEELESIRQFKEMMRREARRRGKSTCCGLTPPVLSARLTNIRTYRRRQFETQLDRGTHEKPVA
jgi:hypothetical protein